jgi:hypothetical protein
MQMDENPNDAMYAPGGAQKICDIFDEIIAGLKKEYYVQACSESDE